MIVKTLDDVLGTEAEVKGRHWVSRRLLLKHDGMGSFPAQHGDLRGRGIGALARQPPRGGLHHLRRGRA